MAGTKKKKKVVNPARGFATTSVASKPKPDQVEAEASIENGVAIDRKGEEVAVAQARVTDENQAGKEVIQDLTPEAFEKQLDDFELQSLVEKHAQKSKREASRQVNRLQTDRRILRGQADPLATKRWLSKELMDEILDLIAADSRTTALENSPASSSQSEEDLTIRLWTLQQVLEGVGFQQESISSVIRHVLNIHENIPVTSKDASWGVEDSLDWLARESAREKLPDYQRKTMQVPKIQPDTSLESSAVAGTFAPKSQLDSRHLNSSNGDQPGRESKPVTSPAVSAAKKTKQAIAYDSDLDPDELLPVYLETKSQLFRLQQPDDKVATKKSPAFTKSATTGVKSSPEAQKLQQKLLGIENDVLFDKFVASQHWDKLRITLEREAAASRASASASITNTAQSSLLSSSDDSSDDEVSRQAKAMGAAMLEADASDDDSGLADLFASLPLTETDPLTGKSNIVVNGADGVKVIIRDFGKVVGVNPKRILEEACRARDPSVSISYKLLSSSSFSHRYSVQILWSKPQEELDPLPSDSSIECSSSPKHFYVAMKSISTPEASQSEAYIATAALFLTFGSSVKEEKVSLRLPAAFRELWTEFASIRKDATDAADRESIRIHRDAIRAKKDRDEEDGVVLKTSFRNRSAINPSNSNGDEVESDKTSRPQPNPEIFRKVWSDKSSTASYQKMLQSRMQLPMWKFRHEVLGAIDRQQVVIICGETGCGKSTQVPSFILEHQLSQGKACKIYCTEPRRISAISLARRVSEELGERKNDLGTSRSLVGYAIRLESNTSKETRLIYATTGIVMRMLEGSTDLKDISHIVLDEVHERTIDSDFLLIVLRKLMTRRPDLKVILMSATVDAERFSKYLDGAPVLYVPGRTFDVDVKFLEDAVELTGFTLANGRDKAHTDLDEEIDLEENGEKGKDDNLKSLRGYSAKTRNTIAQIDEYRIEFDLMAQLISKIANDERFAKYSKAILVFLPGIAEIRQLNDMLVGHPAFSANWYIYPLHSTIASEDQEAAFLVPPEGFRKVVLATNIAETGITIPDVTCVIDTGKHREMRFDERRQLSRLLETFISRANAKQRRGRAGRVQEGLCFHLFTKHRHDEILADQQTPEFLRLSLQDLAIRVKICKLGGIEETLAQALDPPSAKNIRRAVDALVDVRALTLSEELTPLGQQLARLPLDVFLGKLILLGSIFKCLDAAITIAAILSSKSPFSAPFGARAQADTVRLAFKRGDSDVLTVYNAYMAWKRVCSMSASEHQFCRKNFLSVQTLSNIEDLKGQLLVSLVDAGFLPLTEVERTALNKTRFQTRRRHFFELPQRCNINSDNEIVTSSVIAWSFYPKLLKRDGKGWRNVANNQSVSLHPSSVNKGNRDLGWLSYYHIMQAKQFYNAHETTLVEEFAIALLCGDVRCDMYAGVIIVDGNRAKFSVADWKTMLVIKTLRIRLREIMTRSFKSPGKPLTPQQQRWMDVWQKMFTQEIIEK